MTPRSTPQTPPLAELWELTYMRWLMDKRLTDTFERREAFWEGWEHAVEYVQERMEKL